MNSGRRNNNFRNNRRYQNNNNNNNRRRFSGSGSNVDDESTNISPQQRRNFENKRDQHILKAKEQLSAGNKVEAEWHFQHADHYFRMANLGQPKRQENQQRDHNGQENGHHHDNGHQQEHGHQQEQSGESPSESGNNESRDNRSHAPAAAESSHEDISSLPFLKSELPEVKNDSNS